MFDSKLCDRWLPKSPFFIEWLQFVWQPLLVVLLLLIYFGLRWLIQHTRWKNGLRSRRASLFLLGFTATLPLIMLTVAEKGLVVFLPTDSGTAADAIVVLGRGPISYEQRINVAAELWQAKRAPLIFTTGRGDAHSMIEQLEAKGIPKQVLDGENCALTTLQNAVFTAAILHQQDLRQILLITDEPHMLRSLLVFRANGFTVIPHTIGLPTNWGFKDKSLITLREFTGLFSYGLRGLLLRQRSPELNSPDIVNIKQKAEQYGQQRRLKETVNK